MAIPHLVIASTNHFVNGKNKNDAYFISRRERRGAEKTEKKQLRPLLLSELCVKPFCLNVIIKKIA